MKLLSSEFSPFGRKCRALLIETGQQDSVPVENVVNSPLAPASTVCVSNPLGKIPVLVFDEGDALYDSRVICEFLDMRSTGPCMFPQEQDAKWRALRLQATGDGIMDAAVLMRYETIFRPAPNRSREFYDGQWGKIARALSALDVTASELGDAPNIGTISIGCALGYLDARFSDSIDWRSGHSRLAVWFERFSACESMRQTIPQE